MSEVPETFKPRPYQTDAIEALLAGWKGPNNRLAVVLPTGAGKTVVFANLIRTALPHHTGRALVIAHREELIQQAADKIRAVAPELRVGIVKAERDEHQDADVIVASIQTLAVPKRREAIRDIGLVIVDECHHAAAQTYMTVLEHFGTWRGIPTAGFTATMTRTDGGLADVWQDVVFTLDILEMIADGYLVDVKGKRVIVDGLNLDAVKTRAGDLQDGQLAQALDDSGAAKVVADAYVEFASDRAGVVFTPTVDTAKSMAEALTAAGVPAATVWGDMPKDERTDVLARYKTGDLQVLANCMVLTEGFDAPWTSCAVIARPTKSAGLYCQMVGRALRPSDGKTNALILDVMGASTRHKLASIVDLTSRDLTAGDDDDRSLTEKAKEEEERRNRAAAKVEWQDIDLFHQSPVRWLQTYSGTWFVPCGGDTLLFLIPGRMPQHLRVRRWDDAEGIRSPNVDSERPLSAAMIWTEGEARRLAPRAFFERAATWRSRPASPKQRAFCRFNKIVLGAGATQGDASDAMDIHQASQRLDKVKVAAA